MSFYFYVGSGPLKNTITFWSLNIVNDVETSSISFVTMERSDFFLFPSLLQQACSTDCKDSFQFPELWPPVQK